jgi:magnesium-transporting ATPase (P-type)
MTGGPWPAQVADGDGAGLVAAALDTGLSSASAAERLARYGANELPRARRTPLWGLVAGQLRDPLSLVLLAAAVLTIATGDWTDASVILLVIVVNTAVGVAQEVKAGQAIAALSELAAPEARVLRDGEQRLIPAAEVVVGDVLVLAEGDIVPADAGIVDSAALLVDESALTGESVPVDKAAVRRDGSRPGAWPRGGNGHGCGQFDGAGCRADGYPARAYSAAAAPGRARAGAGGRRGAAVRCRSGSRPRARPVPGADGDYRDQPGGGCCP